MQYHLKKIVYGTPINLKVNLYSIINNMVIEILLFIYLKF